MIENIADMVNPESGKTWREENAARPHKIPLGALVEVRRDPEDGEQADSGLRLFVVEHSRDCDQTPLYLLSFKTVDQYQKDVEQEQDARFEANLSSDNRILYQAIKWSNNGATTGGYGEEGLIVIRLP
jgi:hypothetical protein